LPGGVLHRPAEVEPDAVRRHRNVQAPPPGPHILVAKRLRGASRNLKDPFCAEQTVLQWDYSRQKQRSRASLRFRSVLTPDFRDKLTVAEDEKQINRRRKN
jgi:hypothetical protein